MLAGPIEVTMLVIDALEGLGVRYAIGGVARILEYVRF